MPQEQTVNKARHIEVTAKHADTLMAPESGFTHRQTLAGVVRFNAPDLAEEAARVVQADLDDEARRLVVRGFFHEVLQQIGIDDHHRTIGLGDGTLDVDLGLTGGAHLVVAALDLEAGVVEGHDHLVAQVGVVVDRRDREVAALVRRLVAAVGAAVGLERLAGVEVGEASRPGQLDLAAGVDPDRDVRLIVVPPPMLVEALRTGQVDGFCVGEPWNSLAVDAGLGTIVAVASDIWRSPPEKVLGMSSNYIERNPEVCGALVRAVVAAARCLSKAECRDELVRLLSQTRYVGASESLLRGALKSVKGDIDGLLEDVEAALAIAGPLVAGGVGTHEWALPTPERVDLRGRCVLPAFTDSHVHFPTWALADNAGIEGKGWFVDMELDFPAGPAYYLMGFEIDLFTPPRAGFFFLGDARSVGGALAPIPESGLKPLLQEVRYGSRCPGGS